MEEIIRLFKEIQTTSSLNDKKAIIVANKENDKFKECLQFLLDGNIVTGISEKKLGKTISKMPDYMFELTFDNCIRYLKQNNTGTDADIARVQYFINSQPDEYREFYRQMITKTFRLGADAKLVNKCIPGLIPTFDVMLGTSIEKVKLSGKEKIYITRKLNGTRCAFIGDKCMTRQGKEYVGLDHIIKDLRALVGTDTFIDGELIYKNHEGLSDSEAFQKGTGIAMSKEPNKSDLKLVIFDMFPLEEFWQGKSKESYEKRRKSLNLLDQKIQDYHTENLEVVQCLYSGDDHSQIWKWLDQAESLDWEGCMLNLNTPYECKRTKNLVKVKRFYTYDLRVVGVEEGSGRNKGTLGALVVEYKNNTVNVGSGFTDDERREIWNSQDSIIGRVIEVKFKEKTVDKKTGLESLQFPVYCGLRELGKEPSYD